MTNNLLHSEQSCYKPFVYLFNVFALSMKVEASAIADPATSSHSGMIGLTLRVSVWPREANKVMVFIEVDTIELERYLERTYAIKI